MRTKPVLVVLVSALISATIGYGLADHTQAVGTPGPIPTGQIEPLETAGPLAVASDGALYVLTTASAFSSSDQRILVRLSEGEFRDVVGNGYTGYSGDGGQARAAQLSKVSDIIFGSDGDLYIVDGGRVRVVGTNGIIQTVAGGGSAPITDGAPARSVDLGTVTSIAFGSTGDLYLSTPMHLLRMDANGRLTILRAVAASNGTPRGGPLRGFGSLAVANDGTIYVSGGFGSWPIYEVAPNGTATYLAYARAAGGFLSEIERAPSGAIVGDSNESLIMLAGSGAPKFPVGKIPDTDRGPFTLHNFAIAPDGVVYADDVGYSGFALNQQLIEQRGSHITSLWSHKIHSF